MVYSSILGGRLIDIGFEKLCFYHSALDIASPCSQEIFTSSQRSIVLIAEKFAKESMDKATSELREKLSIDSKSKYFKAVASYDGCYQLRSGKEEVDSRGTASQRLFRCISQKSFLTDSHAIAVDSVMNTKIYYKIRKLHLFSRMLGQSEIHLFVLQNSHISPLTTLNQLYPRK